MIGLSRLLRAAALGLASLLVMTATAAAVSGTDTISTLASGLSNPRGAAADGAGNVFVAERLGHRVRRIAPDGTMTTVAGGNGQGFDGDGVATAKQLNLPSDVIVGPGGELYIADEGNRRVRRVSATGFMTTVAGNGNPGGPAATDGATATAVDIGIPLGLALEADGDLLIADWGGHRVHRVTPGGQIFRFAGVGVAGDMADNVSAVTAQLNNPTGLYAGPGEVLIADQGNHKIRRVGADGRITTFAGTTQGFGGDDGPATLAQLSRPTGVVRDGAGNVFVSEVGLAAGEGHRIRKVTPAGIISTISGNGTPSFFGEEDPASAAQLSTPFRVRVDGSGGLLIADEGNGRVRRVRNLVPTASFTAAPGRASAPATVVFDGRGSTDANDPIASYSWDFGDGTLGSGATVSHTYGAPGVYTVWLNVMDDSGATHATNRTVTIDPSVPPPPALTLTQALFQPKWRGSRLSGFLRVRGSASRAARMRLEVLGRVGRRNRVVQRATFRVPAGNFTRRIALRLRPGPTKLPLRYTVRLRELLAQGAAIQALPTRSRPALLRPPRSGVVFRAFIARQIGGRRTARIRGGSGILFAHFDFAAKPRRGLRLRAIWRPPGGRRLVTVVRNVTSTRAVSFIRSRTGALPAGRYRVELRAGRTRIASASVRVT